MKKLAKKYPQFDFKDFREWKIIYDILRSMDVETKVDLRLKATPVAKLTQAELEANEQKALELEEKKRRIAQKIEEDEAAFVLRAAEQLKARTAGNSGSSGGASAMSDVSCS